MAALLVFLLSIEKERFLLTLGGGVLVGCSLVLNLKTAYTGAALVAAFAAWGAVNRRGVRWVAKHLLLLAGGAVLPLLLYIAWERHLGTLGDWWQRVIVQSLGLEARERCTFITARNGPVWVLALVGLGFALKGRRGEVLRRPAGWLALVVVSCLLINWFVVPIAYLKFSRMCRES